MTCAIVIPSRMGSTRFPGKPLADLCGKPMVRWVWEAAVASGAAGRVMVATPDPEIVEACQSFGAEAVLTRHDHPTGTDRLAEVALSVKADVYVNVQGDEPLIDPATILACARPMLDDPGIELASVYGLCTEDEESNPAVVKVVTDLDHYALYFSRYAVPYPRTSRSEGVKKHVGLYGYRRDALARFASWAPTPLELAESLEQLRFLEHGLRMKMSPGLAPALAVDTPEQADDVRRIMEGLAQKQH